MKRLLLLSFLISLNCFGSIESSSLALEKKTMSKNINSKYEIIINALGYDFKALSTGISFGVKVSDTEFIDVGFMRLTSKSTNDYDEDNFFNRDGYVISMGHKKFLGETFFIKTNLYYRTQYFLRGFEYAWSPLDDNDSYIKDLGLTIAIGNQWKWERYSLGFNWIGISRTLHKIELKGDIFGDDLYSISSNFNIGMSF